MDNITSNNNANFYWWFGVVEDRNDPLRLGRCRVRIIGYHTEDNEVLPSENLPWAIPVMPANSAGSSGVSGASLYQSSSASTITIPTAGNSVSFTVGTGLSYNSTGGETVSVYNNSSGLFVGIVTSYNSGCAVFVFLFS